MKRLLLIVLFITGIANAQTTYLQVGNTLQQKDTTINAVSQKTYRTVKGSTGYEYFPTRGWVLSREWAISRVTGLQDALDSKLPLSAGQFNRLTGGLYMNNNLYIYGRNVGNTANLRLFGLSNTDQLWLDPDGIGVNFGWNANFNGPIVGSSTASFTGDISAPTFNGKALSTGHTSALSIVQRDESGKTGLEDLYLGSGYNDWLSTILTGKASTASLSGYLPLTAGSGFPLSGVLHINKDGEYLRAKADNIGGQLFQSFYNSLGTRRGYIGYGISSSPHLDISNEEASGDLNFLTNSQSRYTIDASGNHDFKAGTLKTSSLTPGRVPYIGTAGLIQDDADLQFDGTSLSVGGKVIALNHISQGGGHISTGQITGSEFSGEQMVVDYSSGIDGGRIFKYNSSTNTHGNVFITPYGGNAIIGGTSNNGDKLQVAGTGSFSGTVTVADATASTHAVNKGQLDAAVVSSRPYDVYTVEISQIGTSAPTVNFTLENTIGSIVWTRNGVGDYTATLTGAFVVGKTWAVITNGYQSNSSYQKIEIEKQDANTLNIYTYNGNTNTDGILLNANLEIRVYN